MKKTGVLKTLKIAGTSIVVIFGLLSIIATGGGGGGGDTGATSSNTSGTSSSSTRVTGQAVLGPLSGATIQVQTLDGNVVASGTTQTSTSMNTAGTFSLTIPASDVSNIYVVTVTGGTDIDPTDSGTADTGIESKGAVHAYVTDAELKAGDITVNPITEMIYQDIALQYPDGVDSLTADQWATLLDNEAMKFLNSASSYSGVLSFSPSADKDDSTIAWSKVLSKLVRGIHNGDSDATMMNRVQDLNFSQQSTGTTVSNDGDRMTRLADVANDRVITGLSQNSSGQAGGLNQMYVDDSGAVVNVHVVRTSDTQSYVDATISMAGHVLRLEGTTDLLNNVDFTSDGLDQIVSKLISVSAPNSDSLNITLDKSLASKISDNKLIFTIDGNEPDPSQLAISKDDPEVTWHWSTNISQDSKIVQHNEGTKQNPNWKDSWPVTSNDNLTKSSMYLLKNGTVIYEMPINQYYKISGILQDAAEQVADGYKVLVAAADAGIIVSTDGAAAALGEVTLDAADDFDVTDMAHFFGTSIPTIREETSSSSYVVLKGKRSSKGDLIPGIEYQPIIFFLNHPIWNDDTVSTNKSDRLTMRLEESKYPTISFEPSAASLLNYLSYGSTLTFGTFQFKENKGYVIYPPQRIKFGPINRSEMAVQFKAKFGTSWFEDDVSTHTFLDQTATLVPMFTAYYQTKTDSLTLNASPSVTSDTQDEVESYDWYEGDITLLPNLPDISESPLGTGEILTIPASSLHANGSEYITLRITTQIGAVMYDPQFVYVAAPSWNTPPPVANPGPDQDITTGSTVTLDGSGSTTSNGGSLSYSWSFYSKPSGSSAVISNPTTVNPTFVAGVDGTYEVELVVNDGIADSKAEIVSITASSNGTGGNLSQDWNLMNSTYDQSSGVGSMQAIRNRTEYAYKQLQWDGKSNINISVDVKPVTVPSYAEYIHFEILPTSWLTDWTTGGEPKNSLMQAGYADNQSKMQFLTQLNGSSAVGFNPTAGVWYTYKWSYDYSAKTMAMTVTDESGNQVFSKNFSNVDFGFNSNNRIIGFFSHGMNTDYGNPSETIQFRNLTIN